MLDPLETAVALSEALIDDEDEPDVTIIEMYEEGFDVPVGYINMEDYEVDL